MLIDPAISTALSLPLAALLAASAAHKAKAPAEFSGVLRNYRIVPDRLAPMLAPIVIAVETMLAGGLLAPASRGFAGVGAAILFAVYAAAIAVNLIRGRTGIDCGCGFGRSTGRLSPALLFRNAALIASALVAALPASTRALGVFDFASVVLFTLAAGAFYLAGESLASNAAQFHAAERGR